MTEAMPFLQKAILLSYAPRPFGQGLLEILEILESEEDPRTDFGRLEEQIVRAENPEAVKEILCRKVCSLA